VFTSVYFGEIYLEIWEVLLSIVLIAIFLAIGGAIQVRHLRKGHTHYKFFMWGLSIKLLGGLGFALIYLFYYQGGDTFAYFQSALSMVKLADKNPIDFVDFYFSSNPGEILYYFDHDTGYPLHYMVKDPRTFMVVKLLTPLMFISFHSYLFLSIMMAGITFLGIWKMYSMFCRYYPKAHRGLAFAILLVPSVLFWGSGILKDSITLTATCWLVVYVEVVLIRKNFRPKGILFLLFAAWIIVEVKPYILFALLPLILFWMLYSKIGSIRNTLVKYLLLPVTVFLVMASSYAVLGTLGTESKFNVDNALATAQLTQHDLQQDYYGGSAFNIGVFDGSVAGAIGLAPAAIFAGLFRPGIWEARSLVVLVSALENSVIIILLIWLLWSRGWYSVLNFIKAQPLLGFCIGFSVLLAFVIGLSTSNFGAMVRFKIPLIPFFMAVIMVPYSYLRRKR